MKKISIVSNCYNEVENIPELYIRCMNILHKFPEYEYEFILEDNYSTDGTRDVLRNIANQDKNFKVILNSNNYGHIRSPYNAILQASGDAIILLCSDLQDPPETIEQFINKWKEGYKIVVGIRKDTKSSHIMEFFRKCYYKTLEKFSPGEVIIPKFTGFGLYDHCIIEALRKFHEPYPYFRGLIGEIGFSRAEVLFVQDKRKHGVTHNNFFTLYDMAMTGFVNHTKVPLRLAVFSGFFLAFFSLLIALVYFVYKLVYWDTFSLGIAPLVIGLFFFSAIQLIFIGIIGEYIGAIWTQVKNKPLVIEEERINF